METRGLGLPHPELVSIIDRLKQRATGSRTANAGGYRFTYQVYEPDPSVIGLDACYNEAGHILVSRDLVKIDGRTADLVAWHEFVEIEMKRRGQSHARAHRRAYIEELLAAKELFGEPASLRTYLDWRIGSYPRSKVPDPLGVVAVLMDELKRDRPRKGKLLQIVTPLRI